MSISSTTASPSSKRVWYRNPIVVEIFADSDSSDDDEVVAAPAQRRAVNTNDISIDDKVSEGDVDDEWSSRAQTSEASSSTTALFRHAQQHVPAPAAATSEQSPRLSIVASEQTSRDSSNSSSSTLEDRHTSVDDLILYIRSNKQWSNGNDGTPASSDQDDFRLRVKDFYRARFLRSEQYNSQPWGIFGLFTYIADLRLDLEWAEDAAWRRAHGQPYFSWVDFDEIHTKVYSPVYFCHAVMLLCTITLIVSIGLNGWSFAPIRVNPMMGPSPEVLLQIGALQTMRITAFHEWYRLVSATILHAGLIHYAFNMLALYLIGGAVERVHGTVETALCFCVAAIGGNLLSALFMLPHSVSVGASGGIFGLWGMCLADILVNADVLAMREEDGVTRRVHPGWAIFLLVLDLGVAIVAGLTPYVDNFAHVGGLFYGCCAGLLLVKHLGRTGFFETHDEKEFPYGLLRRSPYWCLASRGLAVAAAVTLFLATTVLLAIQNEDEPNSLCPGCRYISCVPFPFWVSDEADKWWHCDGCEQAQAILHTITTNKGITSLEMDLICPLDLQIVTISFDGAAVPPTQEEIQNELATYCRTYC